MDNEAKARIADFFSADELVDYLNISVQDIIDLFEDRLEEALEDIEELMGVKHG